MQGNNGKLKGSPIDSKRNTGAARPIHTGNAAQSPRIIRTGRLGTGASFQNLLRSLSSIPNVELGILCLKATGSNLQGEIAIASGTVVIGATTNEKTSGWAAMRTLFGLHALEYKYLDYSGIRVVGLDQNYDVKLRHVIEVLPNKLPETPDGLVGQNTLHNVRCVNLDEVRATRRAEEDKLLLLAKDVQKFEEKSTKWLPIAMWGLFAAIALGTVVTYFLCRAH